MTALGNPFSDRLPALLVESERLRALLRAEDRGPRQGVEVRRPEPRHRELGRRGLPSRHRTL